MVITGSTRGIGRAIAELMADEGADLGIGARNEEQVTAAIGALSKKGVKAVGRAVDVADKADYGKWIQECGEALGGIDVFIHNVSAGGGMEGEKNWYNNFELDVMGAVRGCEAALPFLEQSDDAAVIFISTTAAVETFIAPQAYNALKASLITYGKQLSQFWADKKIRVNVVSPGPIYFKGGAWEYIEQNMKDLYDSTLAQIPWGRMGTPEDVAKAVAFLASPASAFTTGVNVVVDGGFTKRVQL